MSLALLFTVAKRVYGPGDRGLAAAWRASMMVFWMARSLRCGVRAITTPSCNA